MKKWLEVEHISKTFYKKNNWLKKKQYEGGIKDISFTASESIVGILGESGSGKTTLVKVIAGIERPDKTSGQIRFMGTKETTKNHVSLIFQDYTTAINPEFTIEEALLESLEPIKNKAEALEKIISMLERVGLSEEYLSNKATNLSGGQIQRVCIARSLLSDANILIFDEAFSSLDLLTTDRLLDLLLQLKQEFDLHYIFVTHNLKLATYFCEEVIFLKEGQLVEAITTQELMSTTSSYVQELIDAQV